MTNVETAALVAAAVAVLPDLDYLARHRGGASAAGSRRLDALRAALRAAVAVPS